MRLHVNKKGLRALGIAESFFQEERYSTLAGVVMRADLVIDGISFTRNTIGGNDSTLSILRLYKSFSRNDINVIILSGCIISYYNIVDVDTLSLRTRRPVICLTYKESKGIENTLRYRFPDDKEKLELYRKLGERKRLELETGKNLFVRLSGINEKEALRVLNLFTLQGSFPEPVRVARILASSARKYVKQIHSS